MAEQSTTEEASLAAWLEHHQDVLPLIVGGLGRPWVRLVSRGVRSAFDASVSCLRLADDVTRRNLGEPAAAIDQVFKCFRGIIARGCRPKGLSIEVGGGELEAWRQEIEAFLRLMAAQATDGWPMPTTWLQLTAQLLTPAVAHAAATALPRLARLYLWNDSTTPADPARKLSLPPTLGPALRACGRLRELDIGGGLGSEAMAQLACVTQLQHLSISYGCSVEDLPLLTALTGLTSLGGVHFPVPTLPEVESCGRMLSRLRKLSVFASEMPLEVLSQPALAGLTSLVAWTLTAPSVGDGGGQAGSFGGWKLPPQLCRVELVGSHHSVAALAGLRLPASLTSLIFNQSFQTLVLEQVEPPDEAALCSALRLVASPAVCWDRGGLQLSTAHGVQPPGHQPWLEAVGNIAGLKTLRLSFSLGEQDLAAMAQHLTSVEALQLSGPAPEHALPLLAGLPRLSALGFSTTLIMEDQQGRALPPAEYHLSAPLEALSSSDPEGRSTASAAARTTTAAAASPAAGCMPAVAPPSCATAVNSAAAVTITTRDYPGLVPMLSSGRTARRRHRRVAVRAHEACGRCGCCGALPQLLPRRLRLRLLPCRLRLRQLLPRRLRLRLQLLLLRDGDDACRGHDAQRLGICPTAAPFVIVRLGLLLLMVVLLLLLRLLQRGLLLLRLRRRRRLLR
ncbi:hypothetical protein TSOC_009811 [Tetrabaena socialis]|uniref:Uncharacterized protein n=1 Tax=Tetrabaena socialis TaxID=47790 RepID=A0A2J7ZUX2_9CHLO|nr:hypothetical protein TSOC_009811 [Tetrabaena socialis]|eukprot:PNH04066.1 hypothetical protein TSOC_009811 [Tetrabaena socialis]